MFNKILNLLFNYSLFLFVSVFSIEAYSQTTKSIKKEFSTSDKNSNIKVSKLKKPSLGSLGINTDVNNLIGLDIWSDMKALDIVTQLNYIPDILLSKSLHNFLSDLYLSTSKPPIGN